MSINTPGEQSRYNVNFDVDQLLFVNRLVGNIQLSDVVGVMNDVRSHPNYELNLPVIWDFSEANLGQITSEQVREFGEKIQQIENPNRPVPLGLVTQRVLDFGIIRQLIGTVGWAEQSYNIFQNYDEALSWVQARRTDLS